MRQTRGAKLSGPSGPSGPSEPNGPSQPNGPSEPNGPSRSSERPRRVLVAGCGAVGSVFACLLAEKGAEVHALGRGEHLAALARDGIAVEGIWGDHRARLAGAHLLAGDAGRAFDAVLVASKSFQSEALLGELDASCLAPDGVAISLQNGLGNVERLASRFGEQRSLAARVIFGAEILAPGRVRVTVEAAPVLLGHPGGACAAAAPWAAVVRDAGIACDPCDDIVAALWGKVFYNAALNPLGALLGLRYGELPADPQRRRVMDRVIEEAFAVAKAEGVRLAWSSAAEYRRHFYGELLPPTGGHRSSMLQDLERGRPTEIDAITGEVCRRGDALGVDVSANRVLLALVRARSASLGTRA